MIVYCVENQINGKRYVGKTSATIAHRWATHRGDARRGSKNPFHCAIRKYGADTFTVTVLAICEPYCVDILERGLIVAFSTHVSTGKGYNATWGGDGTEAGAKHPSFGIPRSAATKALLSVKKLGDKNPSRQARGSEHWNTGKPKAEETKNKIRLKRALQDMSSRVKAFCKRGHARTPANVGHNFTCLQCKKLLRRRTV